MARETVCFEGLLLLILAGLVAWVLRAWPLYRRGGELDVNIRRGAWVALALCGLIVGGAAWQCLRLRRADREAGGVLPLPYNRRGRKLYRPDERLFRVRNGIPRGARLSASQRLSYLREIQAYKLRLRLRKAAREGLIIYPLVCLGLLWLVALGFAPGVPRLCRALVLPHILVLLACGREVVRLGVFTTFLGD